MKTCTHWQKIVWDDVSPVTLAHTYRCVVCGNELAWVSGEVPDDGRAYFERFHRLTVVDKPSELLNQGVTP